MYVCMYLCTYVCVKVRGVFKLTVLLFFIGMHERLPTATGWQWCYSSSQSGHFWLCTFGRLSSNPNNKELHIITIHLEADKLLSACKRSFQQ